LGVFRGGGVINARFLINTGPPIDAVVFETLVQINAPAFTGIVEVLQYNELALFTCISVVPM